MTHPNLAVAKKFSELCNWAHQSWLIRRGLFDDNTNVGKMAHVSYQYAISDLNTITQEYVLLQIAKLHDPAMQRKDFNLSIPYIIEQLVWPAHAVTSLQSLSIELSELSSKILGARNKIISHNDLATILADLPLGSFPEDADVKYFKLLQDFVNTLGQEIEGTPWPFAATVKNDVYALVQQLSKKA